MVQTGHLDAAIGPVQTVGKHGGIEQGHIAGVGHDAGVQSGVVGQRPVGAEPHSLADRWCSRSRHGIAIDVANVDRAGPFIPVAEKMLVRSHSRLEIG